MRKRADRLAAQENNKTKRAARRVIKQERDHQLELEAKIVSLTTSINGPPASAFLNLDLSWMRLVVLQFYCIRLCFRLHPTSQFKGSNDDPIAE